MERTPTTSSITPETADDPVRPARHRPGVSAGVLRLDPLSRGRARRDRTCGRVRGHLARDWLSPAIVCAAGPGCEGLSLPDATSYRDRVRVPPPDSAAPGESRGVPGGGHSLQLRTRSHQPRTPAVDLLGSKHLADAFAGERRVRAYFPPSVP